MREQEYVQAAVAMGNTVSRILFMHIFPDVSAPMPIVVAELVHRTRHHYGGDVKLPRHRRAVHVPTWGSMLAEGREFLDSAWWIVTFPGLAMVLVVLAANVMGDGLHDVLDPKLKQ